MGTNSAFRFGRFECRPASHLLLRDGEPVRVGSRAFAILVALLAAPGQFVAAEDLSAAAWPSTFVDDTNLRVQVSRLRRVLDIDGERSMIVNAPGRGYAIVAPVAGIEQPASPVVDDVEIAVFLKAVADMALAFASGHTRPAVLVRDGEA